MHKVIPNSKIETDVDYYGHDTLEKTYHHEPKFEHEPHIKEGEVIVYASEKVYDKTKLVTERVLSLFIGFHVNKYREKKKISMRELSFLSGVNYKTIQRIEKNGNGRFVPSLSTLLRIANALDRSVCDFLCYPSNDPL